MSVVYRTVRRPPTFGASSRRGGLVHRVREAQRGRSSEGGPSRYIATWMCGSQSTNAIFTNEPDPASHICERCDMACEGMVYHCYPTDGQVLYIGSCIAWASRELHHRKYSSWWPDVARVDRVPYPSLSAARQAEVAAIRAEAPLHNKQHNVKRFRRDGYDYVPNAEAA